MSKFFRELGVIIFSVLFLAGGWALVMQLWDVFGGWMLLVGAVEVIAWLMVVRSMWPKKSAKHG